MKLKNEIEGSVCIVYGAGTIGKVIYELMEKYILAFVDQSSDLISQDIVKGMTYAPENLKNMQFDKIIISVYNRENAIIEKLKNDLNVDNKKIICIRP